MGRQPVVVVGGSLAGMAAAARLAKAGHPVRLLERSDRLGGRWAATACPGHPAHTVDAVPGVLTFPAPWRDLFRKSGRPLEAELARAGLQLVPGPPARHRFADGTELDLPAERGAQEAVLSTVYGPAVAHRWRDLLDHLVEVWQALRPLGMEQELTGPRRLDPGTRALLAPRTSVADLAQRIDHPHLAQVIRSVAWRAGSTPERTPAWRAALLAAERSFGRWVLSGPDATPVPGSRLVELLAERLRLRRVRVDLGHEVDRLELAAGPDPRSGRRSAGPSARRSGRHVVAVGVHRPDGGGERVEAAAVVSALDPWQHLALHPHGLGRSDRLRLASAVPAVAPLLSHRWLGGAEAAATAAGVDDPDGVGVSEVVEHTRDGPVVRYRRHLPDGVLESVHDHARGRPDPSYGLAWRGSRSWWSMPPVRTGVDGLTTAGPHNRAGNHLSQVLLSGALASYACHDHLQALVADPGPASGPPPGAPPAG